MIFRKILLALILCCQLVFLSGYHQANAEGQWYDIGVQERTCSLSYYCTGYGDITGVGEGGSDLGLPYATSITSLSNCRVVGVGWYWGGGVVTCRGYVSYFGHIEDIYYQHLIHISVQFGERVSIGQQVGQSNAYIEWGLNPHWYGIWGPAPHPDAWINPLYSGFSRSLHFRPTVAHKTDTTHFGEHGNLSTTSSTPTPITGINSTQVLRLQEPPTVSKTFSSDLLVDREQGGVFPLPLVTIGIVVLLGECLFFGFLYYKKVYSS